MTLFQKRSINDNTFIFTDYSSRIVTISFIIVIFAFSASLLGKITLRYIDRCRNNVNFGELITRVENAENQVKQIDQAIHNVKAEEPNSLPTIEWVEKFKQSNCYRLCKKSKSFTIAVEKKFDQHMVCLHQIVNVFGFTYRITGKKTLIISRNQFRHVVRDDDEILYWYRKYYPLVTDKRDIHNKAIEHNGDTQLADLKNYLDKKNIKICFIAAPSKEYGLTFLSDHDYRTIYNYDNYLKNLAKIGIPYFDCYQGLTKVCPDKHHWFYRTDHHWRIERVFDLMPLLTEYLREQFNYKFSFADNLFNDKNFTKISYNKLFLGSMGQRAGKYFTSPDDFSYYIPSFPTNYDVHTTSNENKKIDYIGKSFQEAIFQNTLFSTPDVWNSYYDEVYYSNCPEREIINNDITEGKVIIIKDSFGLPLSTFMSFLFNKIKMIDLRYRIPGRDKTIYQEIDDYQPEVVFFIMSCP